MVENLGKGFERQEDTPHNLCFQRKECHPCCQKWKELHNVMGLLLCLWHCVPSIYGGQNEIRRLFKVF